MMKPTNTEKKNEAEMRTRKKKFRFIKRERKTKNKVSRKPLPIREAENEEPLSMMRREETECVTRKKKNTRKKKISVAEVILREITLEKQANFFFKCFIRIYNEIDNLYSCKLFSQNQPIII